eukprot:TRINITY_DN3853_c0_g1_i1.p1 TRINITY_DN3853_c0_g1~~TRINITY_DN3853_c0_g1_i1.p1  ORF type:complete len:133 (-),score=24.58 TRINITY_DN3853_c0_g1_i1:60-458(-)
MSGDGDVSEKPGEMDLLSALQEVLKTALIHDGLVRGARECIKALDRGEAYLCVLAQSCNEPQYTRLVEALCNEHKINLLKVPDGKQLGQWAGLCKLDKDGNPRKVVGASCVVVKDYGDRSAHLDFLLNHFKK